MSYEGYDERLCAQGHYYVCNALGSFSIELCPHCQSGPVWLNAVDETNHTGFPYGTARLRVKTPAEESQEPTYHIPTEEETSKYEVDKNKFLLAIGEI